MFLIFGPAARRSLLRRIEGEKERERERKKKSLCFYFSWLRRGFHLSPFGAAPPCFLSAEALDVLPAVCAGEKKSFNFM